MKSKDDFLAEQGLHNQDGYFSCGAVRVKQVHAAMDNYLKEFLQLTSDERLKLQLNALDALTKRLVSEGKDSCLRFLVSAGIIDKYGNTKLD